jgi:hypothetical protein
VTNDDDRAFILQQNAALGVTRQHLRRCFVCLGTPCKSADGCREERRAWARQQWDKATGADKSGSRIVWDAGD